MGLPKRLHGGISACIITYNEEDNIGRCLQALTFVKEIIIVDSGSNDSTLKIINSFKKNQIKLQRNYPLIKIYKRNFDNYVNQKNFAISKTNENWIIALDADEVIANDLKEEIKKSIDDLSSQINGYYIPRLTNYLGRWINHSGWYPNYQLRLFRKNQGKFKGELVHETMEVAGKTSKLKSPLYHFSYKNISDHIEFINRYTDLAAKEKIKKGKSSNLTLAILEGGWKFFSMYFLRLGFLDGKAGLILAILGFYYNFLKYLKVCERGNEQN